MFHSELIKPEVDDMLPFIQRAMLHHECRIVEDDDPIIFHWHFQKGILDKRMSGLELAMFLLPHMQAILDGGFLSHKPAIENEFRMFLTRITTMPKESLDEVLPWLQVRYRKQEDDLITLNASEMGIYSKRPTYFH